MSLTSTPYLHRVCYSDTDAAGFIYHGRYLEIFERSRAEWLNQRGLSPTKLINEYDILLPVRELKMNFYKPGRLDDLLYIDQVIEHRGRTQVAVKQTASRMIQSGTTDDLQMIASALLHIVCVDTSYDSNPQFVLVKFNKHFFIGPNNGIFSLLINDTGKAEIFLLKRKEDELLNELFADVDQDAMLLHFL